MNTQLKYLVKMLTNFRNYGCWNDFVDTIYCPILISKYRNDHKKYLSENGSLRYFLLIKLHFLKQVLDEFFSHF